MRRVGLVCAALVGAAAMSGCVPPSAQLYAWGSYDSALYDHYKHPEDREGFVANVRRVILEAEQGGKKVPPGCYAEYGFALLEQGQRDGAVQYFTKERDLWPESVPLMDKMIQVAQRQPAAASARSAEGGAM